MRTASLLKSPYMLRCPFAQAGLLLFSSFLLALGLNAVRSTGLDLNWDYFMAEQSQGGSAFESEFPLLDLEEAKKIGRASCRERV